LIAAGHSVAILAWDRIKGPSAQETIDGIAVSRFGPKSAFSNFLLFVVTLPLFWLGCIWTMLRTEWDVVQCNDLDTLPAGLLAAKIRGKPVVYDAHEIYSGMIEPHVPKPVFALVQAVERTMVRHPDAVICVNERFAEILKGWGAPEPTVVMGCVPLAPVPKAQVEALRQSLGIGNRRAILYVGVLEPKRNLVELAEGFNRLAWPDAVFVIGGFGSLEGKIRAAASKNVVFVGEVAPKDVPTYTHLADVLVAIYDPRERNNRDSVPNKLFEAMSGGKPIVVAKGTWTGDTAERVGCGIAVEYDGDAPFDAIRKVLDDPALYAKLSENGVRAYKETYNWEAMAARLVKAYASLLERPST
ncbi:glycosyltransferase family 4 protein, partial [Candidatus Uhrbacteria bacterium]|nr:glycosyltransferase family 4 protein [Candidatus Uhrbacteria bacterium]